MVAIATRGSLSRMPLRIFSSLSSRMWLVADREGLLGALALSDEGLVDLLVLEPREQRRDLVAQDRWVVGFLAMSISSAAAAMSLTMTCAARARSVPRKSGREMSASAKSRARLLPRRASSWNAVRAIGAVRLLPR